MKFHNPWSVRTPPGWSCLIAPPLNRPSPVVQILSGVVGVHVIEKGTPLAQVIPFQRHELAGEVRAETQVEAAERERHHRSTLAGAGWYRARSRSARARTPA